MSYLRRSVSVAVGGCQGSQEHRVARDSLVHVLSLASSHGAAESASGSSLLNTDRSMVSVCVPGSAKSNRKGLCTFTCGDAQG